MYIRILDYTACCNLTLLCQILLKLLLWLTSALPRSTRPVCLKRHLTTSQIILGILKSLALCWYTPLQFYRFLFLSFRLFYFIFWSLDLFHWMCRMCQYIRDVKWYWYSMRSNVLLIKLYFLLPIVTCCTCHLMFRHLIQLKFIFALRWSWSLWAARFSMSYTLITAFLRWEIPCYYLLLVHRAAKITERILITLFQVRLVILYLIVITRAIKVIGGAKFTLF